MKIAELRHYMNERSLDYCLFFNLDSDNNFFYFTQCNAKGAFLVSPEYSRIIVSKLDFSPDIMHKYKTFQWSGGKLLDVVKRHIRRPKRIGIDKDNINQKMFNSIKKGFKNVTLVNISGVCGELRTTKVDAELTKIQKACGITQKIIDYCEARLKSFRTETDVSNFLKIQAIEHNCQLAFEPVVASGKFASVPHHIPRAVRIRKGFCVIDFGVKYQEYCADLTRTYFIGKPNKKEVDLFNKIADAQTQLIHDTIPGVVAGFIYNKAEKMLGKLIHSVGHGVGIEVHEAPALSKDNTQKISEGMVLSVEPAIYVSNAYGIRIEDMVYVTDKGVKLLSKPRELITV